jgi:predicted porin
MKKSLFAIAAVTAFAGAAQAQSSVTVYGILDVGYSGVNSRGGTPALANSTQTSGFDATGSQSSSRLGFRGVEDLGGGMSAFFTLETGINAMGTSAAPGAQPSTFSTTRLGFAGLSQKGVGQFALGLQNTPVHNAVGRTDPGQTNNISGNVIYTATAGAGLGQTTNAYTVRVPNALTLQTERFSGFQINALYNANNQNTSSGSKNDNVAYGGGINFVMKALNVDLAYQNLKNTTLGTGGVPTAASFDPGQTSVIFGTSVNQTQMYAGAVYNFGILKAYAQYINSKVVSNLDANTEVQRSAQQLGVRGNFTPQIEGWASIGNGRLTAGSLQQLAAADASQNFTGYQLGANYILSKRTNLYGIYGSTQVSSSSINASEGRNAYGVGVRHTF